MGPFFQANCPEAEEMLLKHFDHIKQSITSPIANEIEALVLAGGYGRGEGGLYRGSLLNTPLYNDIDYFLFIKSRPSKALSDWIHTIEKEESRFTGIDVEIKLISLSQLERPVRSMMFYDLLAAHQVLWGPKDYLEDYQKSLDPKNIETFEASRLLWNRGTGLLGARYRINKETEIDFVFRNHQKLKLGLGDALLCLKGQYHHLTRERVRRFEDLQVEGLDDCMVELREMHRKSAEYKAYPYDTDMSWAELAAENLYLTKLWDRVFRLIESQRLGVQFTDFQDYCDYPRLLCDCPPVWKSILIAVRDYIRSRQYIRPAWRYPRDSLLRCLAYFHGAILCGKKDLSAMRWLPQPTGKGPAQEIDLVPIYWRSWEHYS